MTSRSRLSNSGRNFSPHASTTSARIAWASFRSRSDTLMVRIIDTEHSSEKAVSDADVRSASKRFVTLQKKQATRGESIRGVARAARVRRRDRELRRVLKRRADMIGVPTFRSKDTKRDRASRGIGPTRSKFGGHKVGPGFGSAHLRRAAVAFIPDCLRALCISAELFSA